MHGVELVDAVIAKARREGMKIFGCGPDVTPQPLDAATLATLAFPNGKPLSPSLARWLAFDAAFLGLTKFEPQNLGEYALAEYDMEWGYSALGSKFAGECYGLPFGSDSRRFLYVGEADSTGEYPVLLLDTDDVPYIGVEYPGIDVYLALHAGIIAHEPSVYGDLIRHKTYGARMKEHAKRYFKGKEGDEIFGLVGAAAFTGMFDSEDLEPPAKPAKATKPKAAAKAKAKAKPIAKAKPVKAARTSPAKKSAKPKAAKSKATKSKAAKPAAKTTTKSKTKRQ